MNKEVLKFLFTGVLSTLVNYGVFYTGHYFFKINYLFCSSTGYIIGLMVGYYLNRTWTFRIKKDTINIKILYSTVYIFNMLIGITILKGLKEILLLDPKVGNLVVIFYTTVFNFCGLKAIVFRKGEKNVESYQ